MPLRTDALTADTDPGATLKDRPRPLLASFSPVPGLEGWRRTQLPPLLSQPQRTQRELLLFFCQQSLSLKTIFRTATGSSTSRPEGGALLGLPPLLNIHKPPRRNSSTFWFLFLLKLTEERRSRGAAAIWRLEWTRNICFLLFFFSLEIW